MPTEALEILIACLRNECIAKIGLNATEAPLGRHHLIDSSTISLCVTNALSLFPQHQENGYLDIQIYHQGSKLLLFDKVDLV